MYPFGDLPRNLAAFCATLRRTHGFLAGPGELADAARALEVVDLADERRVRDALRAVLSDSADTARAFDAAFTAFFFPGPAGVPQPGLPRAGRDGAPDAPPTAVRPPPSPAPGDDAAGDDGAADAARALPVADEPADDRHRASGPTLARYSPLAAEGRASLALPSPSPAWLDAARVFVRRLELGLSRRWRAGRRGRRFDLRRTWRASLQTGGEALEARWRQRTRRRPRLVLVIDGSRSMTDRSALDLAVALAGATRRSETFVFSTALDRITGAVREAAAGRQVSVQLDRDTWGGGTAIGASLATLLHDAAALVGRDTVVVIVSDGLDVGAPGALGAAVHALRRRTAGVVWLNPLLTTPGYEPTASGMAAARPFVTTLASVAGPPDLRQLSPAVRPR